MTEQRAGAQAAGVVVVGPDSVLVGELEPMQDAEVVLPMVALQPGVQRPVPMHVIDMRCGVGIPRWNEDDEIEVDEIEVDIIYRTMVTKTQLVCTNEIRSAQGRQSI